MAFMPPALLLIALILAACQVEQADAPESLVDASNLPAPEALEQETIMIVRGPAVDAPRGQVLRRELRPDDTLLVTLVTFGDGAEEKVVAEDRFRLSVGIADRARQALWRMRPAELQGAEWLVRPSGCEPQSNHDHGEAQVAFIKPDDTVGVFALPSPNSCSTRQAEEARGLFRQVLASFPYSKAAAAFSQQS
jgi:hypothetical protein